MEVDWDKIQNTYTNNPTTGIPEDNFNYIPQVPDTINSTTIVQDSPCPMLPKRGLERPDAINHDRENSVDRDRVQKPDIG